MAKTRTTTTSGRTKQAAQIRHLLVLDALRSGVVPMIAAGLILAVWVLLSVDLIGSKLTLSIAAALVLFIAPYSGSSPFLDEGTNRAAQWDHDHGDAGCLFSGVTFSSLAGWRPAFVDLGVSALAGVVVGAPAGAILWRLARAPVQRLLGRGV